VATVDQHDGGLLRRGRRRSHRALRRPGDLQHRPGQFTGADFIGLLSRHGIQISMDGKGCWRDNVFVERLWRSIKYEEVYLHAYESVATARQGLSRYLCFYNQKRPHTALDGQTPDSVYFNSLPLPLAA
jgi:putative transposase